MTVRVYRSKQSIPLIISYKFILSKKHNRIGAIRATPTAHYNFMNLRGLNIPRLQRKGLITPPDIDSESPGKLPKIDQQYNLVKLRALIKHAFSNFTIL